MTASSGALEASAKTLEEGNGAAAPEATELKEVEAGPSSEPLKGKDEASDGSEGAEPKPGVQNSPRMIVMAILALAVGMAVAALDGTFVSTMLPTISRELNGADSYQWIGTGYLLTSTALAPVWGKLSDIFGRKQLLLLSMIEFVGFSAMCAASNSMTMLILARVFQGIGGGAIMSLTFVVIGEIVSPLERGKYMGIMASITGLCAVIGPFIGGLITDHLSWRWGFWINVPIGCVAVVFYYVALKLPKPQGSLRTQFQRVDYPGVFLCTAAITLLLLAFTWGGNSYPWVSGQVLGTIACALVLVGVFLWWETKSAEPVVPLSLFKNRNYVFSNITLFFVGWAMYGLSYFLPLYFQDVRGMSPTDSGVHQIAVTAFLIPTSITVGLITMRTGKYVMFPQIGMALVAVGVGLLSLLDENSPTWLEIIPQIIAGVGFGMTMSTAQIVAQTNAPDKMIGPATTVANFIRSLGGVMGIAVFATILQNVLSERSRTLVGAVAQEYRLSPAQLQTFGASLTAQYTGASVDTSTIPANALEALYLAIKQGYVSGLHYAFISCIPFAILGCLGALLVRHVPLRKTATTQMSAE